MPPAPILDFVLRVFAFLLRCTFYTLVIVFMQRISGYTGDAYALEIQRRAATPLRGVLNTSPMPPPAMRFGTKGYSWVAQAIMEKGQIKLSPRCIEDMDRQSPRGDLPASLESPRLGHGVGSHSATPSRRGVVPLYARSLPLRDPTSPSLSYLPPGHTAARLRARKEARESASATSSPQVGFAGLEREVRVRSISSQGQVQHGAIRVHTHVKGMFDFDDHEGLGNGGTFEGDLELFIQESPIARTSTPHHMRHLPMQRLKTTASGTNLKLTSKFGGLARAQVFKLQAEEGKVDGEPRHEAIRLGGPFVPFHVRSPSASIFSSTDQDLEQEFESSLSLSSEGPSSLGSTAVHQVSSGLCIRNADDVRVAGNETYGVVYGQDSAFEHPDKMATEEDLLMLRLACAALELGQIEADLSLVDSDVGVIEARLADVRKEVCELKDRSMDSS